MKVVLLAPTPPPAGGIAAWTQRMIETKLSNGWQIIVVDEKLIGGREVFGKNTKKNIFLEIKRCFRIWKDLYIAISDPQVKIVHSCIPAGSTGMLREIICLLIAKIKKKKFIIHYRCTIPNMVNTYIRKNIFKILTKLSDYVIVLNTPSKLFLDELEISTYSSIIPNFIQKDCVLKEKKDISNKVKSILYVGGVTESKGCLNIIEVAKRFPEVTFRLIGNPDKSMMEATKSQNVILTGEKKREFIEKSLDEADIFVFVGDYSGEGFSNALLEAMARGVPTIVSKWAANVDMIENKGGVAIDTRSTLQLEIALKNLLHNKAKRKNMSEWNIEKVKKNYIDLIVTNMYVEIYDKLAEN